jgi:hypothetical protein
MCGLFSTQRLQHENIHPAETQFPLIFCLIIRECNELEILRVVISCYAPINSNYSQKLGTR